MTNKDTTKAIDAANTLLKYCARYKHCKGCIFYRANSIKSCNINYPFAYKYNKEVNDAGARVVK